MEAPLVSIICLCYNHEKFVAEAISSVLKQTYSNIQIIIVDDASTDSSVKVIEELISQDVKVKFLPLTKNMGNCKAFNKGLSMAQGEFVIDFATDDVMMPDRIERQVDFFSSLDPSYGVVFTDALYINAKGVTIKNHYEYLFSKKLLKHIPQGDVYQQVLSTYFIASPTMISRKEVFDKLNGYDENLSYEDFDFWVRSSRTFKYAYFGAITTKIRISEKSMSTGWYRKGDTQLHSTYLVCKKAILLNRSEDDKKALAKRLRYEIRQSIFSDNFKEAKLFYKLLEETGCKNILYDVLILSAELKLPLSAVRNFYHKVRFGK